MVKEKELENARIEALENVVHTLEATANSMYCPNDKEWNMLLIPRDKINKHLEKIRGF